MKFGVRHCRGSRYADPTGAVERVPVTASRGGIEGALSLDGRSGQRLCMIAGGDRLAHEPVPVSLLLFENDLDLSGPNHHYRQQEE